MIAFAKRAVCSSSALNPDDKFLDMLPAIREQGRVASRGLQPDAREDFVAEVIANAFCAYLRLVERGKEDVAFATPLAQFAIRQVRAGRRVGNKMNVRDITSPSCHVFKGVNVERLDHYDAELGEWREVLVEDRRAGPAEVAAARIDVGVWLRSLGRKKGRIARALARGETTGRVASMFGISAGRVSQLRNEFRKNWDEFQSELVVA